MSDLIKSAIVCGAGGFIGGHLTEDLLKNKKVVRVRCIDIKPLHEWHQVFPEAENLVLDLKKSDDCLKAVKDMDVVYNLAADMGGMGFIEKNKALCMLSVLINTHLLMASRQYQVKKYFYASSACVYNADKQRNEQAAALREEDAYPALPEDGYGWEKLFSERMCRHFREDFSVPTFVARFHNVYGPYGTWDGGREKAPAAICRKVIAAKHAGISDIEIWGDGKQTRSFMYIADCIEGIHKIMDNNIIEPINLGSDESVSINDLVSLAEEFAGIKLKRHYDLTAPKGVNGRNSDNTRILSLLKWKPSTSLKNGLKKTYDWIEKEMRRLDFKPTLHN